MHNRNQIDVKSKKINVPLQSSITAEMASEANHSALLHSHLKQLKHYVESNRITALKSVGQFLNDRPNAVSYVGTHNYDYNQLVFKFYTREHNFNNIKPHKRLSSDNHSADPRITS